MRAWSSGRCGDIAEGRLDQAWADLLACHRLARLAGQEPNAGRLPGRRSPDTTWPAAGIRPLLQHAGSRPPRPRRCGPTWPNCRPLPKMADKIEIGERFAFLDSMATVARMDRSSRSGEGRSDGGATWQVLSNDDARAAVDWDMILRSTQQWYDRLVEAGRKPTRARAEARSRAESRGRSGEPAKAAGEGKSLALPVLPIPAGKFPSESASAW